MPEPGERRGARPRHARRHQLRRHPRARELLPRAATSCRSSPGAEVAGVVERDATARAGSAWSRSSAPAATRSTSRSPPADDDPDPRRRVATAGARAAAPGPDRLAPVPDVRAGCAAGESVVVHAAAGGVGSLAVQLGKAFGAGRVIAHRVDRGEARAGARARRRRRRRRHARGPRRRAARGQRRRAASTSCSRWPAARVFDASLEGARAVRAARHLRDRLARAEHGPHRRADAPLAARSSASGSCDCLRSARPSWSPRRCRTCSRASRGRAARGRGRDLSAVRGPPRARGPAGAAAPSGKLVLDPAS